jgi:hypothetical protein
MALQPAEQHDRQDDNDDEDYGPDADIHLRGSFLVPSFFGLATRRRTLKHAARRAAPAEHARRLDPAALVTDYVLSRTPE